MMFNLFEGLAPAQLAEQVDLLVSNPAVRIERIVSNGQCSPEGFWYDQDEAEWVMVLRGAARLRFEQDSRGLELRAGDHVHIPSHCRHRVEWTSLDEPTIWLAVFYADSSQSEI